MPIADELLPTRARQERKNSATPSMPRRPSARFDDIEPKSSLALLGISMPDRARSASSIPMPLRRQTSDIELPRAHGFSSSPDELSYATPPRTVPAAPVAKAAHQSRELSRSAGATPRRTPTSKKMQTPPVSGRPRPAQASSSPGLQRTPSASSTYSRHRAASQTMLTSRKGASQLTRPPTTKRPNPRPRAHSTSSMEAATPPWITNEPLMYKSEAISIGGAAPGSLAALADASNEKSRIEPGGTSWDDVVLPTVAKKLRQQQATLNGEEIELSPRRQSANGADTDFSPRRREPKRESEKREPSPRRREPSREAKQPPAPIVEAGYVQPQLSDTPMASVDIAQVDTRPQMDEDSHDAGCCTKCMIM